MPRSDAQGNPSERLALTLVCGYPPRPSMSEAAPPSGWIVEVLTPGRPDTRVIAGARKNAALPGPPSFAYFNVAIGDVAKAVAAVTAQTDDPAGVLLIEGKRALTTGEIAKLNLKAGEIKPA